MSNALLIYPKQPPTYWGNNYALDLQGIKAVFPPLAGRGRSGPLVSRWWKRQERRDCGFVVHQAA